MIKETKHRRRASNSRAIANKAIKNGFLERKTICEVCGVPGETYAHHWNGYHNPLDVWFVCRSCNRVLPHNGMSLELARLYRSGSRLIIEKYPHLDADQIKKLIALKSASYQAYLFLRDAEMVYSEIADTIEFIDSLGTCAADSLMDSIIKLSQKTAV